jgi:hypothetical protein
MFVRLTWDLLQWCGLLLRPRESLEAENLFLRRQLALYRERGVKPRRVDAATRATLAFLSRWFEWRSALVVVQPQTLIRWHRAGFRLLWRWRSRAGRPPIPKELRELIRRMARENPAWGQERIANELLLKLGLQVSPRTVGKSARAWTAARRSTMVDLPSQSCTGHHCVRFLCRGDQHVPSLVCARRHRTSQPSTDSLQRDGASDRAMDAAATTRGGRIRGAIRVPAARSRQHLLGRAG